MGSNGFVRDVGYKYQVGSITKYLKTDISFVLWTIQILTPNLLRPETLLRHH